MLIAWFIAAFTLEQRNHDAIMNTVLNVKLEPFDFIQHGEQLWKWLSSPHVVRWWGEPEAQLPISLLRPNTGDRALITADSSPVGYLRWQRVDLPVCHEIGLHHIPRRCNAIF